MPGPEKVGVQMTSTVMRQRLGLQRGAARTILHTQPAPTGGWNTRDSLQSMPPQDAVKLENWFPEADRVAVRDGYTSHGTGAVQATCRP